MKLPRDVNGADAARALQRLGFAIRRQTGSHMILRREARTVVVPQRKGLKPGTLKGILEQAGISLNPLSSNSDMWVSIPEKTEWLPLA